MSIVLYRSKKHKPSQSNTQKTEQIYAHSVRHYNWTSCVSKNDLTKFGLQDIQIAIEGDDADVIWRING